MTSTSGTGAILVIRRAGAPASRTSGDLWNGKSVTPMRAAFLLVHAEIGLGGLQLTLTIPGQKRYRKVYLTKSGYWYFNTRSAEGYPIRQALNIGCFSSKEEIVQYMEKLHSDYCIFRCELADFLV